VHNNSVIMRVGLVLPTVNYNILFKIIIYQFLCYRYVWLEVFLLLEAVLPIFSDNILSYNTMLFDNMLNGQCHEIFDPRFFFSSNNPP
jgi:hypothetical protein